MIRQSIPFVIAFASGGILSLMVLFNGQWAASGTALLASWMAHGTGTLAALVFLGTLWAMGRRRGDLPAAPWWAYLGGLSGAVTVMLTSTTVNGVLALSGTLALGLVGQAGYSLLADRWGWFGLPKRRIGAADWGALGLILGGSFLIIFAGGA
jgi:transporter family-2 protein